MGPELDPKPKSEALVKASSVHMENTSINQDPQKNNLPCASNNRDETFDVKPSLVTQTTKPARIEDEVVDIIGVTPSLNIGMAGSDDTDVGETSSSFGTIGSVTDDELLGDEVQSELLGERNSTSHFREYYDMFRTRNKKLTAHWRRFIRPVMWRCKWMELRMKELESQALQYDKELADLDARKKLEFGWSASDDLGSKSLPFLGQNQRNKAMKRKKRKRVEETVDVDSYMSRHNFFSYYENMKSNPYGASMKFDYRYKGNTSKHRNAFGTIEGFSLESQDEDSQLEDLFRNIETVQSRVRQLISRVDMVVYANSRKISSKNKLSVGIPQHSLRNSAQNPPPSVGNGNGFKVESLCIGSQNTSDKTMGNRLLVSSRGEVTRRSEVNTEKMVIGQVKEELNDFEKFGEKPQVSGVKRNRAPVPEVDSMPSKGNAKTKPKKRKRKGSRR